MRVCKKIWLSNKTISICEVRKITCEVSVRTLIPVDLLMANVDGPMNAVSEGTLLDIRFITSRCRLPFDGQSVYYLSLGP